MLCFGTELDVRREVEGVTPVDDLAVSVVRIVGAEGRPADETLEHDCSQTPPITLEAISLAAEDLRCDVVGRTDGGVGHDSTRLSPCVDLRAVADRQIDLVERDGVAILGFVRLAGQQLLVVRVLVLLMEAGGKAEVGELDMAIPIEENVVRLDVTVKTISQRMKQMEQRSHEPVDEAQLVNDLNGKDDLGHVKPGDILGEDLILDQHRHEITTREKFHQHVEEGRILKGREKLHHPRAVGLGQDVPFSPDMSQLILLKHLRLDQGLQGVDLAVGLLLHELDLTKGTFTDDLQSHEVLRDLLCPEKS